jgi:anaerobic ribonucleoside-triphosphate reductase activating protein
MNYYSYDIVFQEVPHEVSLCFTITGCKLQCKGCHSSYLWDENNGTELTVDNFHSLINRYNGFISCVLFMGGEWEPYSLILFLNIARSYNLKTCLYTGEDNILPEIRQSLTFLKTGKYIKELGGLGTSTTNQKFILISSGEDISNVFNGA